GTALGRCAMEQVDEAPGDLLRILLERGVGEEGEQVRPDSGKGLLDPLALGKVGDGWSVRLLNREMAKLELGKLCCKGRVHEIVFFSGGAHRAAPAALRPVRTRFSRTAGEAKGNPRPRPARAARRATRADSRRVAGMRRAGQGASRVAWCAREEAGPAATRSATMA